MCHSHGTSEYRTLHHPAALVLGKFHTPDETFINALRQDADIICLSVAVSPAPVSFVPLQALEVSYVRNIQGFACCKLETQEGLLVCDQDLFWEQKCKMAFRADPVLDRNLPKKLDG